MRTKNISEVQAVLRVSLLSPSGEVIHFSDAGLGRADHGEMSGVLTAITLVDLAFHLETYLLAVAISDSLASIGRWGAK